MKKLSLLLCSLLLILGIWGCKPEKTEETKETEEDIKVVSLVFMDPQIDIILSIEGSDWTYEIDREIRQVYFFLESEPSWDNAISVSSRVFKGKVNDEITAILQDMTDRLRENNIVKFKIEESVVIGEKSQGKYLEYDFDYQGTLIHCSYYI